MHPNDPVRVTVLQAAGPLVRLTAHPDTLAEFVDHLGKWVDHSFPVRSYNRPSTCLAWPTSFDDHEALIDFVRKASDFARIDLVIEPRGGS